MFDITAQQLILRTFAMLFILGFQGLFFAGIAVLLGDPGPRYDGRLTVNPTKHMQPVGALAMVAFRTGWAKPIDVDLDELRWRSLGLAVVVFGSLILLMAATAILWLIQPTLVTALPDTGLTRSINLWIDTTCGMTVWFVVVNLIPIPPFVAGSLLIAVAPRAHQEIIRRLPLVSLGLGAIVIAVASADLIAPAIEELRSLVYPS